MEEHVFLHDCQIEIHQANAWYAVSRHSVGSLTRSWNVTGISPLRRDCEIVGIEIVKSSLPVDGLCRTRRIKLDRRRHLLRAHKHRVAGSGRARDIVHRRVALQTGRNAEKLPCVPGKNGVQGPASCESLRTGRPGFVKGQLPTSAQGKSLPLIEI